MKIDFSEIGPLYRPLHSAEPIADVLGPIVADGPPAALTPEQQRVIHQAIDVVLAAEQAALGLWADALGDAERERSARVAEQALRRASRRDPAD